MGPPGTLRRCIDLVLIQSGFAKPTIIHWQRQQAAVGADENAVAPERAVGRAPDVDGAPDRRRRDDFC